MSDEFALLIFRQYESLFVFDALDGLMMARTAHRARSSMSAAEEKKFDEILLFAASQAGATRIVRFLLSQEVEATFRFRGMNAFHTAARNWHVGVVALLLRSDATLINTFTTGNVRLAAIDIALSAYDQSLFPLCLFEQHAYFDASGAAQRQRRLLHATVTLLLRSGATVNRSPAHYDGEPITPLAIAVEHACMRATAADGDRVAAADSIEIVKELLVAGGGANDQLYQPLDTPLYCAMRSMVNSVYRGRATVSDVKDAFVARLVRVLLEHGACASATWAPVASREIDALRLSPGEPLTCALLAARLGAHRVLSELLLMHGDNGVAPCAFTGNRAFTTLEFVRQYVRDVDPQVLAVLERAQAPDAPLPLSCGWCRAYRDAIPNAPLTMIACERCRRMSYCSEACKSRHWAERHYRVCREQQQQ